MRNLCVLIPSYNEAKAIGSIVGGLKSHGLTVYVVDDGSTDETASVAEDKGAIVIKNEKNLGKGAAMRRGFLHVLKGGYDAVLVMDGDDQHDVTDISHLIKTMRADNALGIVIGNRMKDASSMPFVRKVTNRFMSFLMSKITGQHIPDSQCGFRLIRREVLESIKLESSNFEIESEMIVRAAKAGLKIGSVPVKTVYRDEKSRINPAIDTFRFIILMAKLAFKK